jgi:hypothetical protein
MWSCSTSRTRSAVQTRIPSGTRWWRSLAPQTADGSPSGPTPSAPAASSRTVAGARRDRTRRARGGDGRSAPHHLPSRVRVGRLRPRHRRRRGVRNNGPRAGGARRHLGGGRLPRPVAGVTTGLDDRHSWRTKAAPRPGAVTQANCASTRSRSLRSMRPSRRLKARSSEPAGSLQPTRVAPRPSTERWSTAGARSCSRAAA